MRAGSFAVSAWALLLAGATAASAQQPHPIPPPPAPAALSVPNPLAAMTPGPRDLYRSPDGSDRFQHISPHPAPPPVFFFPGPFLPGPYIPGAYFPGAYFPYASATEYRPALDAFNRRSMEAAIGRGGLILESVPDNAQVYVDSFYVGAAADFGLRGRTLMLAAGPHRVEVRAPGYEVLAFKVMIPRDDVVRFRGDMQPLPSTTPPGVTAPAAPPKSFYVIPNCYAGDKPPTGALPRGCDVKNLQTRK